MTITGNEKGLIVRHSERTSVQLPAEFVISDAYGKQVHFSATSEAIGPHHMSCTAVDVSAGGVGIESRHFLPRQTTGVIRVFAPDPKSGNGNGGPREPLLEHAVKVRRTEMIGRETRYALGLAFIDCSPDLDERIALLSDHLRNGAAAGRDAGAAVGDAGKEPNRA